MPLGGIQWDLNDSEHSEFHWSYLENPSGSRTCHDLKLVLTRRGDGRGFDFLDENTQEQRMQFDYDCVAGGKVSRLSGKKKVKLSQLPLDCRRFFSFLNVIDRLRDSEKIRFEVFGSRSCLVFAFELLEGIFEIDYQPLDESRNAVQAEFFQFFPMDQLVHPNTSIRKCNEDDPLFEIPALFRELVPQKFDPSLNSMQEPIHFSGILFPFQKQCLDWMLKREAGKIPKDLKEIYPMFQKLRTNSDLNLLYNQYTSRLTRSNCYFPGYGTSFRGGCLCLEMGLGKSIISIALICRSFENRPSSSPLPDNFTSPINALVAKGTLIICPNTIIQQWKDYFESFAPDLTVYCFLNRNVDLLMNRSTPEIYQDWFKESLKNCLDADVVLTTHETIRKEFNFNYSWESGRKSRTKQFPCPLLCIKWHRLILDEAQMVSKSSHAGSLASRINSEIRWIVSGTPVRHVSDFQNLLMFLQDELFSNQKWIKALISDPYISKENYSALKELLSEILYYHGKNDLGVAEQINVPPITEKIIALDFENVVESEIYKHLHQKCENIFFSSKFEKALAQLLKLRQCCVHPWVAQPYLYQSMEHLSSLSSFAELKSDLLKDAKNDFEIATRALCNAKASLGMYQILEGQVKEGNSVFVEVLNAVDSRLTAISTRMQLNLKNNEEGTEFELTRLKISLGLLNEMMGNLDEAKSSLSECLSTTQKQRGYILTRLQNSESNTRRKENGDLNFSQLVTQVTYGMICKICKIGYSGIEQCYSILEKVHDQLRDFIISQKATIDRYVREFSLRKLDLESPEQFTEFISMQKMKEISDFIVLFLQIHHILLEDCIHLNFQKEQIEQKTEDFLIPWAVEVLKEFDISQNILDVESLNQRRKQQIWDLTTEESNWLLQDYLCTQGLCRVFQKLESRKKDLSENEFHSSLKRVSDYLKQISGEISCSLDSSTWAWMALRYGALRGLLAARELTCGYDDEAQALWESAYCIREELPNQFKPSEELEQIWMRQVPLHLPLSHINEKIQHQEKNLESKERTLRYREFVCDEANLSKILDQDCSICHDKLRFPMITFCLHVFCEPCIKSCFRSSYSKSKCPLCRYNISITDCFHVNVHENKYQEFPVVQEISGTKLRALALKLLDIQKSTPNAKSLVFSQWDSALLLISKILRKCGIAHVRLSGGVVEKVNCLTQFEQSDKVNVLLVPMRSGSAGLTLTSASYAFIMDVCVNENFENQAMNRIHRIGQKNNTTIYRMVMANTVEERILQSRSILQTKHSGKDLRNGENITGEMMEQFLTTNSSFEE